MTTAKRKIPPLVKHGIVIGLICLLALFFDWCLYDFRGEKDVFHTYNPGIAPKTPVQEILADVEVRQTIQMPEGIKSITGFSLLFANWNGTNTENIVVSILDLQGDTVQEFMISDENPADNSWVDFKLTHPYMEKRFVIAVKSYGYTGNGVTIWSSNADSYDGGELMVNGISTGGDLCFKLTSGQESILPLYTFRYIVLFFAVLVLIACYFALFLINRTFLKYTIIIFAVGLMYVLVMTPYSQYDIIDHAPNSEFVSNALVFNNDRLSLIGTQFAIGIKQEQTSAGYISFVENFFKVDRSVVRKTPIADYRGYPKMNYPISYLPQAIGITLARLLWISNFQVYYAGVITNLISYALISALAITIIPIRFRNMLIILALVPMALYQAASYSQDTFVNSMSFLFIAYLLKLKEDDRQIGVKQISILILIICLLAPPKVFYGLLGLCVFVLPQKKFTNKLRYWIAVSLTIVLPLAVTMIFKLPQAIDISTSNTSLDWETYVVSYMIEHPLNVIKIFINTILQQTKYWIGSFSGANWANLPIPMPQYPFYIFCLLLVFSVFYCMEEGCGLSVKNRINLFFACFLIFGAILAAEFVGYTPVGSNVVEGVQGRYFIPIALPLLCMCSNGLLYYSRKDFAKSLIACAIVLNVIIVNYVVRITITAM